MHRMFLAHEIKGLSIAYLCTGCFERTKYKYIGPLRFVKIWNAVGLRWMKYKGKNISSRAEKEATYLVKKFVNRIL